MAEEMIETVPWESDEAEDWESDEAFSESEDSAEDIGERARRRRRRNRFRPSRGVQGMVMRAPDGRARTVPFPKKLATVEETNKGLASQELGRRALEKRLEELETKQRVLLKKDSAASGLVTLVIGGGLAAYGAIKAAQQTSESKFTNWASQSSTQMAALSSATQLVTTGARLVINGQYHRSGIGIAADVFATVQLAAFAFGSLSTPNVLEEVDDTANKDPKDFANGARVFDKKAKKVFTVVETKNGHYFVAA